MEEQALYEWAASSLNAQWWTRRLTRIRESSPQLLPFFPLPCPSFMPKCLGLHQVLF